jgi:hypothetical protein
MRLIKSALEYRSIAEIKKVPNGVRGIYCLYKKRGKSYGLVYVGMSGVNGRVAARLRKHQKSLNKDWSHFSYYEVWDNITDAEIAELEGLFLQLSRFDKNTNLQNSQNTHQPLVQLRRKTERELNLEAITQKKLGIL